MDNFAVVWIDTDGKFKLKGYTSESDAYDDSRMTNECGLPAVVISRQEVIDGDFRSNAQIEEEDERDAEGA